MQRRIFSLLAMALLLTAAVWAQDTRGAISGRVTDPSGAVVAGAQVTVSNAGTGMKVALTTNSEGIYRANLLPPGMYQIEFTAAGFKKLVRNDVELRVADRLDINVSLEIGASEQAITITAETPLLNAETASLGTVVDNQRVAKLPLSYGNPFLLIGISAGVVFAGDPRLDRPFEPTHITNYSMGGTRGNLNDIMIDGAPTTATANANEVIASYVPPPDIVQEFKVQTATFDAQFGQTQGGVTNMVIKSGTNDFHGSAGYSFYRPSMLANDFFNNKNGLAVPDFRFDRWGGSIGGPVRIPKVYNGKNKSFFLFGYEGIHDSRPRHDDGTNTIPTPAMHNGDFSGLLKLGSQYTIYNPYSRTGPVNGRYTETPFQNNTIPSSMFNKVGKAILDYFPTTEKTPTDALGVGNYRDASLADPLKYYNLTTRWDQNIGDRQRFFVRYSHYIRNDTYNNYFNNPYMGIVFWFYSTNVAFDHVYTISPTIVLNTRYSYNRFIRGTDMPDYSRNFDLASLGASAQWVSQVPKDVARFPRINWASTSYIGNGVGGENRPVGDHTVGATLTKSAGAHAIRTGFEYRAYQETDKFFGNAQTAQFTLGCTWTRGPLDNSPCAGSNYGQSVAELLLGLPDSALISRSADYAETSGSWGMFVQDDWRVTNKLTLQLGLRYEFETPLHERYNRSTLGFDTSFVQDFSAAAQAAYAKSYPTISGGFPELPPSAFALRGGMTFPTPGGNGDPLYNTPKNIFLPRFGLAYQISPKTVIRTGGGLFAGFLGQRRSDVLQNGFSQNTNMVLTRDSGLTFLTDMTNPFNAGITEPRGAADGPKTFLGQGFSFFNQNPKVPMTARWQFGVQHQFRQFVLEADYVGSKTNHIEITRNINTLPAQYLSTLKTRDDAWNNYLTANISNPLYNLQPGNTNGIYTGTNTNRQTLLSPFVAFGSNALNTTENTGYSWYHSAQLSMEKRFSKGYTIKGSYTYAKWMQAVNLLNASDLAPVREISDNDAPHRFAVSGIWELPFGKNKPLLSGAGPVVSRLVGGWQVSTVWTLQSGFPLAWGNVIYYGDPSNILLPLDQRNTDHWFNVAGFETNSSKQLLGNQVRTWPLRFGTLRRQRINNVDLALIKDTRIREGMNAQFRAEGLNAFNHAYFPSPLMTVTTAQKADDTGFGQIAPSTQANYARRLQLSVKLVF